MTASATTLPPNRRNGLLTLALIGSLLAMPFFIGAGLYFSGWHPQRTVQHGVLLDPPVPLPPHGLIAADGRDIPTAALDGKWLLVLSIDGPCQQDCASRIDAMRRIQVSLNKDMGRLRRVILSDRDDDPALAALGQQQPDLSVFSAPAGWLHAGTGHHLHIVDPQGRRIMDYPADAPPGEVRADLERLLKFAWNA